MRWKTVALAGALTPTALGCSVVKYASQTIVNEPSVVHNQVGIEHKLRSQARSLWREVRTQYPRRAFTAEFRDGFLDGYVDYLDRGGNGSIPAVPPPKYTRHKKYFTENGQCLVKDYFLGFKYGQDIAIATGKRQFLTVPVLLPMENKNPPAFMIQPPAGTLSAPTPAMPIPLPTPTPPPAPSPVPTPPTPQTNATPAVTAPLTPTATTPVASSSVPTPVATPSLPIPVVKLPAPPLEVPEFPEYVPTPPITDELPVVPPNHTELPVVPPSHPEAAGK
ncbi:MAG: hypothetical protein K8U57_12120 [Planctomycetes bacterium]|nr:hypothetical protein [Planctomycetota bacterium]